MAKKGKCKSCGKDHYYSWAIILGNEDSHILPHPTKAQMKKYLIPRLKDLVRLLKKEIKCQK